jgi:chromosome segregation ATPase
MASFKDQLDQKQRQIDDLQNRLQKFADIPHDWRGKIDQARAELPGWAKEELEQLRRKGRQFEDDQREAGRWKYITHGIAIVIGAGLGFVLRFV